MIENFENYLKKKNRSGKAPEHAGAGGRQSVFDDLDDLEDLDDDDLDDIDDQDDSGMPDEPGARDELNGPDRPAGTDAAGRTDLSARDVPEDENTGDEGAGGNGPEEGCPDEEYPDEEYPDGEDPDDEYGEDDLDDGSGLFSGRTFRVGGLSLKTVSALIIAAAVIAAALFAILINRNWFYSRYEVVFSWPQEDAVSYSYCNIDGSILRYGADGATLYDQEGNTIWDVAYAMEDPSVVSRGSIFAVYDAGGTDIVVCDRSGKIGEITTKHPVIRADIARQGTIATIQEDRQNVWIEYYSKEGSTIAEIKTSIEEPGYPMDLAVSPDGMLLAVAYSGFSEGTQTGTIRFYSFGSYGQNQMDNRVAAFDYADRVIPEVVSLGDDGFAAFRDNGFSIYSGGGIPTQQADVALEGRIQAVFYDETHLGLLTEDPENGLTHMRVYDTRGREITDRVISVNYQKIELFGEEVNFYNGSAVHVYMLSGTEKFDGEYQEAALTVFAIGKYRYAAVTENSIDLIRLK